MFGFGALPPRRQPERRGRQPTQAGSADIRTAIAAMAHAERYDEDAVRAAFQNLKTLWPDAPDVWLEKSIKNVKSNQASSQGFQEQQILSAEIAAQRSQDIRGEIQRLRQQDEELRKRLRAARELSRTRSQEAAIMLERANQLLVEKERYAGSFREESARATALNDRVKDLSETMALQRRQIDKLMTTTVDREAARERVVRCNRSLEEAKKDYIALQEDLEETRQRAQEYEQDFKRCEAECEGKVRKMAEDLRAAQEDLRETQESVLGLQAEKDQVEASLREANRDAEGARESVFAVQEERDASVARERARAKLYREKLERSRANVEKAKDKAAYYKEMGRSALELLDQERGARPAAATAAEANPPSAADKPRPPPRDAAASVAKPPAGKPPAPSAAGRPRPPPKPEVRGGSSQWDDVDVVEF